MVHVQSIKFGAWIMISLNLLVAFCAIWMFSRMAPAIQEILSRNARSLYACEQMLGFLAHAASANTSGERVIFRQQFEHALANAKANITEYGEASALQEIENIYPAAFSGDREAISKTISALACLSQSNRSAMNEAAAHADQLGNAGAWAIVFMALILFVVGTLFRRSVVRILIAPLEEIEAVLTARRNGDLFRRCIGVNLPRDVQNVLKNINELIDELMVDYTNKWYKTVIDVNEKIVDGTIEGGLDVGLGAYTAGLYPLAKYTSEVYSSISGLKEKTDNIANFYLVCRMIYPVDKAYENAVVRYNNGECDINEVKAMFELNKATKVYAYECIEGFANGEDKDIAGERIAEINRINMKNGKIEISQGVGNGGMGGR